MAVDQISERQIKDSYDLAQSLIVAHDAAVYLEENRRYVSSKATLTNQLVRYCPEIIGFLLNTLMISNFGEGGTNVDNLLSTFPVQENFLYFDKKVIFRLVI